ncbi:MAG: hypothetical protein ABIE42_10140 [Candidatus Eisenbacteria bacterium]
MSRVENRPTRVPRESLSERIAGLDIAEAKTFAAFIREGDLDMPTPCWGAIATRFEDVFASDEDRLAVLNALIAEGDRRPLDLFLQVNRKRPALLASLCERADELPAPVQCALIAIPEAALFVEEALERFGPDARRLWEGDESLRRTECEQLRSRIGQLMSFQYYVPDDFDPRDEVNRGRLESPKHDNQLLGDFAK